MGTNKRGLLNGSTFYRRETVYRNAFLASRGKIDPPAILAAAGCTEALALLVASARRLACLEVLEAYESGRITFRQLWRACEYVGDEKTQLLVVGLRTRAA